MNGKMAYANEQSPVSGVDGDTNDYASQRANGDRSPLTVEELQAVVQDLQAQVAELQASAPAPEPDPQGLGFDPSMAPDMGDEQEMPGDLAAGEEQGEPGAPPAPPGGEPMPGGPGGLDPKMLMALMGGFRG